jgi:GNAT superfamily N-acetyltransferase
VTTDASAGPDVVTPTGHRVRPATVADLPTCAAIWRESLNDYLGRLAQAEIPDDLAPILRLYAHLHATDPTTFLVAEAPGGAGAPTERGGERGGERGRGRPAIDAFVVVLRRDGLWFLSMLFVRPAVQGRGLGRALLGVVASAAAEAGSGGGGSALVSSRATATDTAQPISNGLYGSLGMVPRIPLLRLVGLPARDGAFDPLPAGVEAIAFDEVDGAPDGLGRSALAAELDALDRDAAGFSRQVDHGFHIREGRVGFLFRDRDGRAVGYGYSSEAGRVGPIAVRDGALLGPIVGHLIHVVRPRGAFGMWVPGTAGAAIVPLLRAGFRFDGFPVLLCWDRPFADFARYIPASPGLL